jgi:hypothetical protein
MTRQKRDTEWDAIDAELDRLDFIETIVEIPSIDWTVAPGIVNGVLRAIWERVELGPDLMPARFIWRRQEWRGNKSRILTVATRLAKV